MIELIGIALLAITPWLLKAVTNAVKAISAIRYSPDKAFFLRFALALLSIGVATLHAILGGEPVPSTAIEQFVDAIKVFVEALIFWLSATGLYLIKKQ